MLWNQLFKTGLVGVVLGVVLSFTRAAAAQDEEGADDQVQACAQAYEQAQVNRNDGKLVQAQEHLRVCVQDVCPDFVKTDCGQWLSDVRRDIPSVIFSVVDSAGKELQDAGVSLDGEPVALDGRPVELDPGQHEVTYEFEGESTTEKVGIRQGEKNRFIKLEVVTDKDSDGDGIMDSVDACPNEAGVQAENGCPAVVPPPPPSGDQGLRMGAYVGWGVGGAGLLTWGVFGLLGNAQEGDVLDRCGSGGVNCTNDEKEQFIDEVDTKFLIANIGLGVGIAGAATGTVLFFLSSGDSSSSEQTGVNVGVQPSARGGGVLNVSGSF